MTTTRRRTSSIALLASLGLALTACSGQSEEEAAFEDTSETTPSPAEEQGDGEATEEGTDSDEQEGTDGPTSDEDASEGSSTHTARAGFMGTASSLEAETTAVEESDDARLLAPGLDLRITEVGQLEELPVQAFEQAGGEILTQDSEKVSTVEPAEGEVFHVARYESTDPQLPGVEEIPRSNAKVRVEGSEAGSVFTGEGDRQQGTLVVSAPEELSPEDLVLEVTTGEDDGLTQSLSLVDGTRTSDDAPQLYTVDGFEVELTDAESMNLPYERMNGAPETIRGEVEQAHLTPYHPEHGWSRSGELFLVVTVDEPKNHDNKSTIQVEMPDGTTIEPEAENSSLVRGFDGPMTFSVPADAGEATVRLTPKAKPKLDVITGDPAEATVTWSVTDGDSAPEESGKDADEDSSEQKGGESSED